MVKGQVFGGKCGELLASYDQELLCWKTSQMSFDWGEEKFLDPLPKSGMMRNGALYPQKVKVRHTRGLDGFVLPTPIANLPANGLQSESTWNRKEKHKLGTLLDIEICEKMNITREEAIGSDMRLNPHFVQWMMGFPKGWLD